MRPEQAVEMQISRYREMTKEQRVAVALRLHELARDMARLGIRRQHPGASAEEIENLLRDRTKLAYSP